jgi:hypothetical protein
MTPGARLAAAIEVFAAIEHERRPAGDALKAWAWRIALPAPATARASPAWSTTRCAAAPPAPI